MGPVYGAGRPAPLTPRGAECTARMYSPDLWLRHIPPEAEWASDTGGGRAPDADGGRLREGRRAA
ncbi:hypothetical protein Aros01_04502 [Streptosporangium roseum]|uniref:Uncharacterized protein n=1 Tax=Streptosporangium roseum (strain ATCC 12428 / DSM 43021 / JCM 3005 / KCTC 9067 / NCIMB 10171 / NRRL 2505 / NI 9100) TaxID=479432 RepID=D2B067_STRRD|nr:hypothetical protein Sros_6352 [Streptosporangium roseum DSM 43021]